MVEFVVIPECLSLFKPVNIKPISLCSIYVEFTVAEVL